MMVLTGVAFQTRTVLEANTGLQITPAILLQTYIYNYICTIGEDGVPFMNTTTGFFLTSCKL